MSLAAFASFGDRPGDSSKDKLHHSLLIYVGIAMSVGGIIWGSICLHYGLTFQATFPLSYALITGINFAIFAVSKSFVFARFIQILISILLPFIFQWSLGGFIPSGAVMLWALIVLISMITVQSIWLNLFWLALYLLLTIVSGVINDSLLHNGWGIDVPPGLVTTFFVLNLSIISTFAVILNIYFVKRHETVQAGLEQSEKKLTAIVEYIGKAIININKYGIILFANKKICELFGYEEHELEGKNINNLVRRKSRDQDNPIMQTDEVFIHHLLMNVSEHVGKRQNGVIFPISLDLTTMALDDEKMYVGMISELTTASTVDQSANQ